MATGEGRCCRFMVGLLAVAVGTMMVPLTGKVGAKMKHLTETK